MTAWESIGIEDDRLFRRSGCGESDGRKATGRATVLDGVSTRCPTRIRWSRPASSTSATRSSCPRSQVVAGYDPVMTTFEGRVGEGDLLMPVSYIKSVGNTAKVGQ